MSLESNESIQIVVVSMLVVTASFRCGLCLKRLFSKKFFTDNMLLVFSGCPAIADHLIKDYCSTINYELSFVSQIEFFPIFVLN